MDITAHLFQLQEIDNKIQRFRARMEEIERVLNADSRLQKAALNVEKSKKEVHLAQVSIRGIEETIREINVKIEISEKNLYGGSVRNPKELQDLQNEIASLKRQRSNLEDNQLAEMIRFEELEMQSQADQAQYSEILTLVTSESSALAGEKTASLATVERLLVERAGLLHSIPAESLRLYEDLCKSKKGRAIAKIDEDSCSECGAPIRPSLIQAARSRLTLAYCPSCGRILFAG